MSRTEMEAKRLEAEAAQAETRRAQQEAQSGEEQQRRLQAKLEERKRRKAQRAAAAEDDEAMSGTLRADASVVIGEKYTFPNGDVYQGEWSEGKQFHGKGKFTIAKTGASYDGDWVEGKREGKGRYKQPLSNFEYHGEWVANKRQGSGEQLESAGKFVGEFDDGKMTGQGTFIFTSGAMYKGGFSEDEFEGQGEYTFADGSKYKGAFLNGMQEGFGVFTSKANGHKYEGQWHDDMKHGRGKYAAPDFSYDGEWKENTMHGKGTYTYDSGDTYEGDWVSDKEHGHGVYTFAAGGSYDGEWADGRRQGKGTTVGPKGEKYEGEWAADQKQGFGTFTYPSGATYQGQWADDNMNGQGVYTFASGKQLIVQCEDGKFADKREAGSPDEAAALIALLQSGGDAAKGALVAAGSPGGAKPIPEWLQELDMIDDETKRIFVAEKIDELSFKHLSEADLKELGVPLGPRKLLVKEIQRRGGRRDSMFARLGNTFTIPTDDESLKRIFNEWDIDQDGGIDAIEFRDAVKAFEKDLGLEMTDEDIEKQFKKADMNADSKLSYDEFALYMIARAKQ